MLNVGESSSKLSPVITDLSRSGQGSMRLMVVSAQTAAPNDEVGASSVAPIPSEDGPTCLADACAASSLWLFARSCKRANQRGAITTSVDDSSSATVRAARHI